MAFVKKTPASMKCLRQKKAYGQKGVDAYTGLLRNRPRKFLNVLKKSHAC